ncbi:HNH endonuclease family protein [Neiella marina]|uniref:HNH endonuclease family protein n=1 Tax=Neiella holothuriorum TaxID=2870530 RepID=A0ABS7EG97_9GAMM|nr:HNH endonuclease family protein [Neiella holothuriorum]MBW8191323.1 HNH endonuclease family protein [Neiella holothuriorum]
MGSKSILMSSVAGALVAGIALIASSAAIAASPSSANEQGGTYSRSDWPHWLDDDSDCQNTRAETLINYSKVVVTFRRTKGCIVDLGEWYDPYSGHTFNKASDLDIDKIVALEWAHRHGGADWPTSKKAQFANDPVNLQPVSLSLNRQKGSKGPTEWLPPNQQYRCQYVARFAAVVRQYGLQFSTSDAQAVRQMLTTCGYGESGFMPS